MPARKLILTAYIDPSLGSMLLQAMAGIFIALAVMGRRLFLAPLEWLLFRRSAPKDQRDESTEHM
jgi:hypothetical protein